MFGTFLRSWGGGSVQKGEVTPVTIDIGMVQYWVYEIHNYKNKLKIFNDMGKVH